jgi:phage baseplate assembly protein W
MYNYKRNDYVDSHVSKTKYDMDFNLKKHPISNDIFKLKNIEAIKSSIKTLVLLNHYEKPFHPDIGCDIYKSLFENMNEPGLKFTMEDYITETIEKYEPRVELKKVNILFQEDQNNVEITIYFVPVNAVDTVSMTMYLKILR